MKKIDLVRRISAVMRENDMRKHILLPKHVFHISDDDGITKDFYVRGSERSVPYTSGDIEAVLDACQYVIHEAMKEGEEIVLRGLGTLALIWHKPKSMRTVSGDDIITNGHYVPKFICGTELKRCAKVYEQSLADRQANEPPVTADECEEDEAE